MGVTWGEGAGGGGGQLAEGESQTFLASVPHAFSKVYYRRRRNRPLRTHQYQAKTDKVKSNTSCFTYTDTHSATDIVYRGGCSNCGCGRASTPSGIRMHIGDRGGSRTFQKGGGVHLTSANKKGGGPGGWSNFG